ncbi:hypothetical protein B0H21DRAFT_64010 [Amylocystis lapponica]|nr:hypothetical protein B0H21DRAFT_64010 [Amylocystis lapponica]
MSNSSAEELQPSSEFEAEFKAMMLLILFRYRYLAEFVLYAYDYFLTFSREVELIWKRKFTGVTVLFILNRYAWMLRLVLSTIPFPLRSLVLPSNGCTSSVVDVVDVVGTNVPTLLVLSLGFTYFGIQMCVLIPERVSFDPVNGCSFEYASFSYDAVLYIVLYICGNILDFCVLVLTWMRTYRIHKHASEVHIKASIATLILRDGTITWGIMFMLGLADTVCYYLDVPELDLAYDFKSILGPMLLSRFMLSLREVYLSGTGGGTSRSVGSMHFASNIVGVVGAPLDHDEWRDSHIDADEDPQPSQISDNPLAAGLWDVDANLDGAGENAYEMDAITRAADAHEVDGDAEA